MVYTFRFFFLQNAVCFIFLTNLVPVLFTFYIQDVLKIKKNNSGAKRVTTVSYVASFRVSPQPKDLSDADRPLVNFLYNGSRYWNQRRIRRQITLFRDTFQFGTQVATFGMPNKRDGFSSRKTAVIIVVEIVTPEER